MLELEQARQRIFDCLSTLPSEAVLLSEAAGRILAQPLVGTLDLPPVDNSAMDGYAVRAADLAQASREKPVTLQLLGEIAAGGSATFNVKPQTCVRLFTGSPLPAGADAVIMQEDVTVASGNPQKVVCSESVKPWENVRLRGEDVKKGAALLTKGQRLGTGAIALLAAQGLKKIEVTRRPLIAVLATGNELIEPGARFDAGKIYESNRVMLQEPLRVVGALARVYAIVPDSVRIRTEFWSEHWPNAMR